MPAGMRERTVVINGFSKGFAMTGWRLGYCCGPEAIIEQMTKLHQFAIMCAPTTSQYAAVEGLRNCEDEVEEMRRSYNQRRRFLMHEFNRMGLSVLSRSELLCVSDIKKFGMSSEEFATRLLQEEKWLLFRALHSENAGRDSCGSHMHILWRPERSAGAGERFITRLREKK